MTTYQIKNPQFGNVPAQTLNLQLPEEGRIFRPVGSVGEFYQKTPQGLKSFNITDLLGSNKGQYGNYGGQSAVAERILKEQYGIDYSSLPQLNLADVFTAYQKMGLGSQQSGTGSYIPPITGGSLEELIKEQQTAKEQQLQAKETAQRQKYLASATDFSNWQQAQKPAYQGGSIVDALSYYGLPNDRAFRGQLATQEGLVSSPEQYEQLTKTGQNAAINTALVKNLAKDAGARAKSFYEANKGKDLTGAQPQDLRTQYNAPTPTGEPEPEWVAQLDPFSKSMYEMVNNYLHPTTQRKTLVDEYNQLRATSGIEALETKYMDIERVINGTEQDIRDEITKAGGFGTESQVQALTTARNKTLIIQAQTLQDQIKNKNDYLDNVLKLEGQDRAEADANFERATGLMEKLADRQMTMDKNNRDSYQQIVDNAGYDGLAKMYSGSTLQLYVEKTLNLPSGTLSDKTLSSQLQTKWQQQLAIDKKNLALRQQEVGISQKTLQMKIDQQNQENEQYGQLLFSGNSVPSLISAYGGDRNGAVLAADKMSMALTGKHYNQQAEELRYQASKRFVSNLNSSQMVRYQGLAGSVVNTINEVSSLSKEMGMQGIPLVNKVKLEAYIQATGSSSEKGQLAARYLGAVNTLKEEFANLANGGYAPTDEAWRLANSQINENYDVNKLNASLYEVQRLINYRTAAFGDLSPILPGSLQTTGTDEYVNVISPSGVSGRILAKDKDAALAEGYKVK